MIRYRIGKSIWNTFIYIFGSPNLIVDNVSKILVSKNWFRIFPAYVSRTCKRKGCIHTCMYYVHRKKDWKKLRFSSYIYIYETCESVFGGVQNKQEMDFYLWASCIPPLASRTHPASCLWSHAPYIACVHTDTLLSRGQGRTQVFGHTDMYRRTRRKRRIRMNRKYEKSPKGRSFFSYSFLT